MSRYVRIIWFVVLLAALPVLHIATRVREAGPVPEAWALPDAIGAWQGDRIFYSQDPEVERVFRDEDLQEPGVCPVSGGGLNSVSPRERAFLPRDVQIDRRLYRGPDGARRHVTMLVTGESREGIHRPDWCLAAQDVPVGPVFFVTVVGWGGEPFDVGVYPIFTAESAADRLPTQYFVYWFEDGQARTPYNWSRILRAGWSRLLGGQAQRWAYFAIQMERPRGEGDDAHIVAEAVRWFMQRGTERGDDQS